MTAEPVEDAPHHEHHAERVRESAVLSALVREECEPQLLDPPKPLEFRRVDQRDEQILDRIDARQRDYVVYRVPVHPLSHGGRLHRLRRSGSARERGALPIGDLYRVRDEVVHPPGVLTHELHPDPLLRMLAHPDHLSIPEKDAFFLAPV